MPKPPDLAEGSEYLLGWFYQLNDRRQQGFDGLQPMTYQEIDAWVRRKSILIHPDEIDVLTAMDSAFLRAVRDFRESQKET